jgi:hypothetical protein
MASPGSQARFVEGNLLRHVTVMSLTSSVGPVSLTIPATSPSDLPWNSWYEISRTSDYWKMGVWVTEKVEVYLQTSI